MKSRKGTIMNAFMNSFMSVSGAAWLVALTLAVGSLTGCGGSVDDGELARLQEDIAKLETSFATVKGTYQGEVIAPLSARGGARPLRAEVGIYVVYKSAGSDSRGRPKVLPVLKGRFRLLDTVGENDDEVLDVYYESLTGKMILTRPDAAAAPAGGSAFVISGTVLESVYRAEVTREGGLWARFEARRVSETAQGPSLGADEERRARLIDIFRRLEGVYEGPVATRTGMDFKARLTLFVFEEPVSGTDGRTTSRPVLMARFSRLDMEPGVGADWSLRASYDPLTGRLTLRNSEPAGGGASVPGAGLFSAEGFIRGDKIELSVTDHRGPLGRLRALRVR